MSRKITRKGIVRKLDALVSKYVRTMWRRCVVCGTTENLTAGHLFSRVAYSTRWDIHHGGNTYAQCASCNLSHEYDPYPFTRWYLDNFGEKKYDELHTRHVTPRIFKTWQLVELCEEIQKEYDKLETAYLNE